MCIKVCHDPGWGCKQNVNKTCIVFYDDDNDSVLSGNFFVDFYKEKSPLK